MSNTYWARFDSNTANNPGLNLTHAPAQEISFIKSGPDGDLVLDYSEGAGDPNTQIQIGDATYDFSYQMSGTLPTFRGDGANKVPDQYEGSKVYVLTVHDYPSDGESARLTFMPDEAATEREMNAFGQGAIKLKDADTTSTGAVCFGEGTLIDTPSGPRAVEDLRAGDWVTTFDDGPQRILWISHSEFSWPGHSENELPIQIRAGALGPGRPARNLVVSPQHKVLLQDPDKDGGVVLVPAKGLTTRPGIRVMRGRRSVTYYHMLLQSHAVLVSEGLPSESFYPGPQALRMLQKPQRDEILAHLPALFAGGVTGYGPHRWPVLSMRATRDLTTAISPARPTFQSWQAAA